MSVEKLIDEKLEAFRVSLVKGINSTMSRMYEDVMREVRSEIAVLKSEIGVLRDEAAPKPDPDRSITTTNESGAIMLKPEVELAIVKGVCDKLSRAIVPKITERVLETVRTDINENVLPMINNTMEYIGYVTQDGQELITDYRREVVGANEQKLIGDARLARNTFGHYRRAFNDDE